jgi:hypothetical protein
MRTEQPTTMERRNPFQKERRAPRRPHEKPFWQIEEEKAKLALEEKKKEAERGLEDTVENFPTLGGNTAVQSGSIWSGSRKFSELASEWKSTDDQQKEEEERQKNSTETTTSYDEVFQLPRFRNIRRFVEPEDEYCDEVNIPPVDTIPEEEEWTLVDNRKYRKPKPEFDFSEEGLDNYDENEEDGTVWGAAEEHETCWDDRRR